jgi:hypothetical protein
MISTGHAVSLKVTKEGYCSNRPWRPIRLYEASKLPRFLDNRLIDGGEVVSLTRRPAPLIPGRFLVLISVTGWMARWSICLLTKLRAARQGIGILSAAGGRYASLHHKVPTGPGDQSACWIKNIEDILHGYYAPEACSWPLTSA